MTKPDEKALIGLLRECASGDTELCNKCPYQDLEDCGGQMMLDAADVIEAKISKIDKLREACGL